MTVQPSENGGGRRTGSFLSFYDRSDKVSFMVNRFSGPMCQRPELNGWRFLGLYLYCLLLSALATVLAIIVSTWPQWIRALFH